MSEDTPKFAAWRADFWAFGGGGGGVERERLYGGFEGGVREVEVKVKKKC